MSPSSESGVYKAIGEIDKRVAVIENEQKHFVGAVEGLTMVTRDLQETIDGLKVKVGIIIGISAVASAIVTNVLSEFITRR